MGGQDFEWELYHRQKELEARIGKSSAEYTELVAHADRLFRTLGPRHGLSLMWQRILCNLLLASNHADIDEVESMNCRIMSVLRRNGEHPGEMLPYLPRLGHALVHLRRFEKAKSIYELALEFNAVNGGDSDQVVGIRKGLQACAQANPKYIRGL